MIELKDARPGDIVLFKGKGLIFSILSSILWIFDKEWRSLKWKPWHTGFLTYKHGEYWELCESLRQGIKLTNLTDYDPKTYRIYRWFKKEPASDLILKYLGTHLHKKYDIEFYFWCTLSYLFRHYFNRPIKYLLDNRFCCWENIYHFASHCKKPIGCKYDCPLITDLCKSLDVK